MCLTGSGFNPSIPSPNDGSAFRKWGKDAAAGMSKKEKKTKVKKIIIIFSINFPQQNLKNSIGQGFYIYMYISATFSIRSDSKSFKIAKREHVF